MPLGRPSQLRLAFDRLELDVGQAPLAEQSAPSYSVNYC
jgi:hypothetical protein